MNKLNVALTTAAMVSAALVGSAEAKSTHLSDQTAVRLSYSALQSRAGQFGIVSVKDELRVRRVSHDELNYSHVRLDQYYKGVPVFGEQLVTHLDPNGRLTFVSGTFTPMGALSVRPTLSPSRALDIALADFAQGTSETPKVELVILALDGEATLTYKISVKDIESDSPANWMYFIDAHSGDIVWSYDNLQTAPANGTGKTLYSGTVAIGTNSVAAGYELTDPSRGSLQTTDMMNGSAGNGVAFVDADNTFGDGTENDRATLGADAHYGAAMTWDYYKNIYGRNGLRNDNKGNLSRVHYSVNYVNAFWDDSCFCMTYGDGDGVMSDALVTLDVAGHEMTHGLTSVTSGLIYAGQSGGLNESMSDIFGTAVEFYASESDTSTDVPDYWVGESCWTPAVARDALRYLDDPTKDGISIDHASRYRPGMDVHYSSGVSNNVFYLLAEGGKNRTSGMTVTGIGRDKAEAIFYLANTEYFTPNTNWKRARQATIQAATELYGQAEADATSKAWEACGVRS